MVVLLVLKRGPVMPSDSTGIIQRDGTIPPVL